MMETDIVNTFFGERDSLNPKEANLFPIVIVRYGGQFVLGYAWGERRLEKSRELSEIAREFKERTGDYVPDDDGTIPGVKDDIVAFMDQLLADE